MLLWYKFILENIHALAQKALVIRVAQQDINTTNHPRKAAAGLTLVALLRGKTALGSS